MPIHLPSAGLSIFTIPKNGGTTLWAWVYYLRCGGNLPPGNVYRQSWLTQGTVQPGTMIVRRDPVERFISGYRNFRDKRGLEMAFDEFMEKFPELYNTNRSVRHHFRPQCSYFPDRRLEDFDHVVDFENYGEAKELLEEATGVMLPEIRFQKSVFSDFTVRDWQRALIRDTYQCDYEAGFGKDMRRGRVPRAPG